MKDYRVEIKIKNNLLYRAMIEEGFETAAELSRASGTSNSDVGAALALKKTLFGKKGEVRLVYQKLSVTLKRLPEDLVPEAHHHHALKKNKGAIEADIGDISYLLPPSAPDQLCIENQMKEKINEALGKLTGRQQRVLEMRFGLKEHAPHILAEVAKKEGLSLERVRQIEKKALIVLKNKVRKLNSEIN